MTTIDRILSSVDSIFVMAEECGWGQSELNDHITATVYNALSAKQPAGRAKYTNGQREYVAGYIRAKHIALQEKTEFCYLLGGRLYSVKSTKGSKRPHYSAFNDNPHFMPDASTGGIYWRKHGKRFY